MDYTFKKSKARELQEWIVGKIREALPDENISIFSRLKGDVASDIEDELSRTGLAVVVSPYLVLEYAALAMNLRAQDGVIAVSVVENVVNNSLQMDGVEIHADNILEAVVHKLYDERFYNAPLRFQAVEDMSPENESVVILNQKINLTIDF